MKVIRMCFFLLFSLYTQYTHNRRAVPFTLSRMLSVNAAHWHRRVQFSILHNYKHLHKIRLQREKANANRVFPSDFPDKIFNNLRAIQPFCLCESECVYSCNQNMTTTRALKKLWINFSVPHSVCFMNIRCKKKTNVKEKEWDGRNASSLFENESKIEERTRRMDFGKMPYFNNITILSKNVNTLFAEWERQQKITSNKIK